MALVARTDPRENRKRWLTVLLWKVFSTWHRSCRQADAAVFSPPPFASICLHSYTFLPFPVWWKCTPLSYWNTNLDTSFRLVFCVADGYRGQSAIVPHELLFQIAQIQEAASLPEMSKWKLRRKTKKNGIHYLPRRRGNISFNFISFSWQFSIVSICHMTNLLHKHSF